MKACVGYSPTRRSSASTPISLCLMRACTVLAWALLVILTGFLGLVWSIPSSANCAAPSDNPSLTTSSTITLPKSKALGAIVSTPTIPKWPAIPSAASLFRRFGSVIGLLSPHGERYAGSVAVETTDCTLALTTRPARVLLTKRFPQLLF